MNSKFEKKIVQKCAKNRVCPQGRARGSVHPSHYKPGSLEVDGIDEAGFPTARITPTNG